MSIQQGSTPPPTPLPPLPKTPVVSSQKVLSLRECQRCALGFYSQHTSTNSLEARKARENSFRSSLTFYCSDQLCADFRIDNSAIRFLAKSLHGLAGSSATY